MNSTILFTKSENGTLDRVIGLNDTTILTTNKNLSQLSDVDTTGVSDQTVLLYNSSNAKWEATLPSFTSLSDVSFNNLQASNVIKWNSTQQRWVNRDLGYAILTISGKIKDSVFNTGNVSFNLLNPSNYEAGTFTISPYSNNNIVINTTTTFNISGLISGASYRVEMNFNYSIFSSPGAIATISNSIQNPGQVAVANCSLSSTGRVASTSMSAVTATTTALTFTALKTPSGTFVGTTPLDTNITISIIEM